MRSARAGLLLPIPVPRGPEWRRRARSNARPGLIKSARLGARSIVQKGTRRAVPCACAVRAAPRPPLPHRPPQPAGPAQPRLRGLARLSAAPLPYSSQPGVQQHVQLGQQGCPPQEGAGALPDGVLGAVAAVRAEAAAPWRSTTASMSSTRPLEDADFDNKPMVLLVGQYSTGKTTFIRHLIEQDFQGMRLGPSPPPTLSSRSCTAPPRAWCRATRSSSTRGGPSASSTPSATPSSTGSRSSIRGGGKGPPGSRPSSDYCPRETPQRPLPGTWSPATFQRKPLPRGLRVGVAGSRGSVSPPPPLLPEFPRLSV